MGVMPSCRVGVAGRAEDMERGVRWSAPRSAVMKQNAPLPAHSPPLLSALQGRTRERVLEMVFIYQKDETFYTVHIHNHTPLCGMFIQLYECLLVRAPNLCIRCNIYTYHHMWFMKTTLN